MNENDWEQPTKNNTPRQERLEVVVTDENEHTFVVTGIFDGTMWSDPSGYSFTDFGYKTVKWWRFPSEWPGSEDDNRKKKTGRKAI